MKKILASLLSTIILTSVCSNTVSCSKDNFTKKLWVVVPGFIYDKTYHQNTYKGANEFIDQKYNFSQKASYYEVKTYNNINFIQAYKTLNYYKADYAVLTDFTQQSYLKYASKYIKKVLFISGFVNKEETGNSKMVGVAFKNEVAGFYAGILDSAYLSTLPADKRVTSVFGGVDIPLSVDNYMAGFLYAHVYWNYVKFNNLDHTQLDKIVHFYNKNKKPEYVKLTPYQGNIQENGKMQIGSNNHNFFTNSFLISKAKPLVKTLIKNNAITIFPVAGSEIADAVDIFKNMNNSQYYKVIGVDTDQSKIYGKKYVLASAIDELDKATNDSLKLLDTLKNGEFQNLSSNLTEKNRDWCGVSGVPDSIINILKQQTTTQKSYILNTIKRFTKYYNEKITEKSNWGNVTNMLNNIDNKYIIEGIK